MSTAIEKSEQSALGKFQYTPPEARYSFTAAMSSGWKMSKISDVVSYLPSALKVASLRPGALLVNPFESESPHSLPPAILGFTSHLVERATDAPATKNLPVRPVRVLSELIFQTLSQKDVQPPSLDDDADDVELALLVRLELELEAELVRLLALLVRLELLLRLLLLGLELALLVRLLLLDELELELDELELELLLALEALLVELDELELELLLELLELLVSSSCRPQTQTL